jgi:hypothetical protein
VYSCLNSSKSYVERFLSGILFTGIWNPTAGFESAVARRVHKSCELVRDMNGDGHISLLRSSAQVSASLTQRTFCPRDETLQCHILLQYTVQQVLFSVVHRLLHLLHVRVIHERIWIRIPDVPDHDICGFPVSFAKFWVRTRTVWYLSDSLFPFFPSPLSPTFSFFH